MQYFDFYPALSQDKTVLMIWNWSHCTFHSMALESETQLPWLEDTHFFLLICAFVFNFLILILNEKCSSQSINIFLYIEYGILL